MQRNAKTRPWWAKRTPSEPAQSLPTERLSRPNRRQFQLEILEERNLLAGASLSDFFQAILAATASGLNSASSSTSTTNPTSTSTDPTPDPSNLTFTIGAGDNSYTINATTVLPSFNYVQGPAGVVAPGNPFDPSTAGIGFTNTVAAGAPIISEWTRTANPDESITMAGDAFSASPTGATQFYVFSQTGTGPGKITMITTQNTTDSSAIATLPTSAVLPTNSMYMLWASDNNGLGRPVLVNQTETWWVGPNAAQAGQTLSVFGRNLSQTGSEWIKGVSAGTAPTWVWIAPDAGGPMQQVTVNSSNPYRVDFQLPSTLAAGSYTVWVHNGRGGDYGWGTPLKFTVRSPIENGTQWSGPIYTTANSSALLAMTTNAVGADDGALLQSVLNQAGSSTTGYATVFLPAGTFKIANPLNIPNNVRLLGQGMNSTILQAIAGPAFQSLGLIYSNGASLSSNNVVIEDLTLNSGYNPLGATDPAYTGGIKDLVRMFSPTDLRFTRVRFDSKSAEAFEIYKGNRVTVDSCDFYTANGALFNQCQQVFVTNSTFQLTNLATQAIYSIGSQTLSITGNTARSESTADASRTAQWGLRLFVNQQGGRYQYLGKNTTYNIGLPTSTDGNVGEQILWEGGGPQYIGSPTTTSNTVLTFNTTTANIDFGNGRYYAVVVQGKGVGQVRRIVSEVNVGSGMNLTVDSPFAVAVDQTSVIQLLTLATQSVVYGNNLNGLTENVTRDTYIGPAGVMLFGGTNNILVEQNTLTNIRLGISVWSLMSPRTSAPNQYETSTFNVVANNTIVGSRYAMMIEVGSGAGVTTDALGRDRRTLSGNVFRGNSVQNALSSGFDVAFIGNSMTSVPDQTIDNLVVERNTFVGLPVGMNLAQTTRVDYRGIVTTAPILHDSLIYKNTMQQTAGSTTSRPPGSKGIIIGDAETPTLVSNSIIGFESTYTDTIPLYVSATGTPNTYAFTFSPRDVDRKGGNFSYWIDWDNNGTWDPINTGAVQQTIAGGVAIFTHTYATAGNISLRFMIVSTGDVNNYVWTVNLNLNSTTNIKPLAKMVSTALLAGPTSNYLEYAFTFNTNTLLAKSAIYTYAFDWNNDGSYEDSRYGIDNITITKKFAAAGLTSVGYSVADTAGNKTTGKLTLDPGIRSVYYEGSEREDWVSFTEIYPGVVRADMTRVGGRDLATPTSLSYGNILGGVYVDGNGGPDYLNAGGLTTRSATITGGAGSDTIVGGLQNDSLWGDGPAGAVKTADASNAISGGAGSDSIWTGTSTDVVVASPTSTIQLANAFYYVASGLSSTTAAKSGLAITATVITANGTLLNLGSVTAAGDTANVSVAPKSTTSTASKSAAPTSTTTVTGTPVITSSTRTSSGSSGGALTPANVDAAVLDLGIADDHEMEEYLDVMVAELALD